MNAYHIFALEWSEGQMDWFVNDQKIFAMTQDEWFTGIVAKDDNKFAPFDQPFYLMLNLAVGGNLPDNIYQCEGDIETSKKCLSVPH